MRTNWKLSAKVAEELGAVPKECYKNGVLAAIRLDAVYVEGHVLDSRIGFVFDHGWVEHNGEIIDPTLVLINGHEEDYSYFPAERWSADRVHEEGFQADDEELFLPMHIYVGVYRPVVQDRMKKSMIEAYKALDPVVGDVMEEQFG